MGFFGEIRKLLFGVKSVSKSAGNKVVEKGKDIGEDLVERSEDFFDDAKEFAVDAKEDIKEGFEKVKDKMGDLGKDSGSKLSEFGKKTAEKAKDIGDKIADSPVVEKAADISEKVGEKVLDVGEDMVEKGKDLSVKVGEKVLDAKDKIVEKAKDLAGDLGKKFDETVEKAEKMAEEEKNNPKSEFADTPLDASGSLLDDKDDFFTKAAAYADGDHQAFNEGKIEILDEKIESKETPASVAGFDDLDGDGDEITDDAIIIQDDESDPVEKSPIVTEANESTETIDDTLKEAVELAEKAEDLVAQSDQKKNLIEEQIDESIPSDESDEDREESDSEPQDKTK